MKRFVLRYLVYFLLILLVPSIFLNIYLLQHRVVNSGVAVIGVIDGDTMVLEGKVKVRLRHVDAPELTYCGGEQAKKELETLVGGKRVRLEEQLPDQYGRSMALIYVGDTLVNEQLLENGWVRYHSDRTSVTDKMKEVAKIAKSKKKGIYGVCQSTVNTRHPDCDIKGNIDPANGRKRYFITGCAQYKFAVVEEDIGEQWFCSEKEAKSAGYEKAETCGK